MLPKEPRRIPANKFGAGGIAWDEPEGGGGGGGEEIVPEPATTLLSPELAFSWRRSTPNVARDR
jgi:hypothetical protein